MTQTKNKTRPYKYVCKRCKSEDIRWDAWALYNPDTQQMELADWFDMTFCCECDGETSQEKVYI